MMGDCQSSVVPFMQSCESLDLFQHNWKHFNHVFHS